MDTSPVVLNLKIDQEIGIEHKFATVGPVNGATLLDRVEVPIDPFELRCLAKPQECTNGLSLAFWINILDVYADFTFLLRQEHSVDGSGVNFRVVTRGTQKMFQISVIDHQISHKRCTVEFKFNASTWTHVAFTWYDGSEMYLFLNGNTYSPVYGSCLGIGRPSPAPLSVALIPFIVLGSRDATILVDDVALWDRLLHFNEVYKVYYTVITGKRTIAVLKLRIPLEALTSQLNCSPFLGLAPADYVKMLLGINKVTIQGEVWTCTHKVAFNFIESPHLGDFTEQVACMHLEI